MFVLSLSLYSKSVNNNHHDSYDELSSIPISNAPVSKVFNNRKLKNTGGRKQIYFLFCLNI